MKKKTLLVVVLDETGSMRTVRDQTISGFNEFLDSQEDKALGETRVTLVKFNSDRIDIPYSDKLIEEVPKLTRASYVPDATTPLYDAVARAIKDTEEKFRVSQQVLNKLSGQDKNYGPLIIMAIITDGEENASREYNREQVFAMITDKKKMGWAFVFMGSNQDSWSNASKMAFAQGATINYAPTKMRAAFNGFSEATRNYRMVANVAMDQTNNIEDYRRELTAAQENYWQGRKTADEEKEENNV